VSTTSQSNEFSERRTPHLSLVIPAYNEGSRLLSTLSECVTYLASLPYPTELIVADDGSSDDTFSVATRFAAHHPTVHAISILHGGKATALRVGMSAADGEFIAFSDADLATPLSYLAHFVALAESGADIVAGSREGSTASRIGEPWYRHAMGRIFNRLVQLLLIPGINDTQCGFKLFKRAVIRDLLSTARLYTVGQGVAGARVTAFDVELLAIARLRGFHLVMEPVIWRYGDQSKVNPARDSLYNLRDVLAVFVNAKLGRYAGEAKP